MYVSFVKAQRRDNGELETLVEVSALARGQTDKAPVIQQWRRFEKEPELRKTFCAVLLCLDNVFRAPLRFPDKAAAEVAKKKDEARQQAVAAISEAKQADDKAREALREAAEAAKLAADKARRAGIKAPRLGVTKDDKEVESLRKQLSAAEDEIKSLKDNAPLPPSPEGLPEAGQSEKPKDEGPKDSERPPDE